MNKPSNTNMIIFGTPGRGKNSSILNDDILQSIRKCKSKSKSKSKSHIISRTGSIKI